MELPVGNLTQLKRKESDAAVSPKYGRRVKGGAGGGARSGSLENVSVCKMRLASVRFSCCLKNDFTERFEDIRAQETRFDLYQQPFQTDFETVLTESQSARIELQCDGNLMESSSIGARTNTTRKICRENGSQKSGPMQCNTCPSSVVRTCVKNASRS